MSSVLIILTGASRGFGKAIYEVFSKTWPHAHFLILTQSHLSEVFPNTTPVQVNLALPNSVESISEALKVISDYQTIYLIHNAGSLGELNMIPLLNPKELNETVDLNLTSFIQLTIHTLRRLTASQSIRIINISSLAACQPFECWSIYGTLKTARETFLKHLVHEHVEGGYVLRVLNYAPGPMDTRMQEVIRERMPEGNLKQVYSDMKLKGRLVDPKTSAHKLVEIVLADSYVNGAHIDYYDCLDK